jgi:hypothetical protein
VPRGLEIDLAGLRTAGTDPSISQPRQVSVRMATGTGIETPCDGNGRGAWPGHFDSMLTPEIVADRVG